MLWGEECAHYFGRSMSEREYRRIMIYVSQPGKRSIPIFRHFLWKEMIDKLTNPFVDIINEKESYEEYFSVSYKIKVLIIYIHH